MIKTRLLALAAFACTTLAAPALADTIHVRDAWIPVYGDQQRNAPVFLTLVNMGDSADRLLRVHSNDATKVSIQTMGVTDDALRPHTLDTVVLPVGVPVALSPGGAWLMLEGMHAPARSRAMYTVVLVFEHAGEIEYRIRGRLSNIGVDTLENLRTDPMQSTTQPERTEGMDDALRSDPFLR